MRLLLVCGLGAIVPLMPTSSLAGPPEGVDLAQAAKSAPPAQAPTDMLSRALRELLVQFLPRTLYEGSPGWGNSAQVPNGLKWPGHGLRRRPELRYDLKNDGTWRHVRLSADDLVHSLLFSVNNLQFDAKDRMTFRIDAWFNVRFELEQQQWKSGVRLYAVGARARLRVKLALACEATMRLEATGVLIPDLVVRLRVTESHVAYDHLVVEHLAGVGGTGARWLGELVRSTVHQLRPSVERNLRDRASAAILKAGDSKEVRLSVRSLLNTK
jgi:hypothetical protein